jgi:hypothetical protein
MWKAKFARKDEMPRLENPWWQGVNKDPSGFFVAQEISHLDDWSTVNASQFLTQVRLHGLPLNAPCIAFGVGLLSRAFVAA